MSKTTIQQPVSVNEAESKGSAAPSGSAMWMCPACNHVMTEEQSKGYRGCPSGMHFAQHVPVELVPCPDCYGGHFRPCQMCGDTGMATQRLPNIGLRRGSLRLRPTNDCECLYWCDVRPDIRFLTGHHENCPKRGDLTEAAKKLISELVRGIELWAAEEDGVYEPCWKPYKRAKAVLGQFDWKEDEALAAHG